MNLDTLVNIVLTSKAGDWSRIPGPTQPQYVGEVISSNDHWLEVSEHYTRYVYHHDISISIAIGMPTHAREDTLYFEGIVFTDPAIRGLYADILYDGQVVHRDHLISVDGGRALLPLPNYEVAPSGAALGMEAFAYSATTNAVSFARLIDELSGAQAFDHYMARANIIEVPNP